MGARGIPVWGDPAAWENPNFDPVVISTQPAPRAAQPAEGRDWTGYAFAAGTLVLVLLGAALLARRLRIRKPTTA